MNTLSNSISNSASKPVNWAGVVLLSITFWLSSSLLLDFVVMPGMFISGIMSQPDFGTAGYTLFWVFNRIELVCVALVLTGLLVNRQGRGEEAVMVSGLRSRWAMEIAVALLGITLMLTYALSPAMGALGISLDAFDTSHTTPAGMNLLHGLYFGLEALKLVGCVALLKLSFQDLKVVEVPALARIDG
ncbi:MAG: DUF4149 domain-containing protein [Nodosilinea sp.]